MTLEITDNITEPYPLSEELGLFSTHQPDSDDWVDQVTQLWARHHNAFVISRARLHSEAPYVFLNTSMYRLSHESISSGLQANMADLLSEHIPNVADPLSEYMEEFVEHARQMRQAYTHRIEALQEDGAFEWIPINRPSQRDFWAFVRSTPFTQEAGLFLQDNGNLRAVWKGNNGSHVGIQFLGSQMAEYVIFKRRSPSGHVSRVAGIDTLEGVKLQIRAFDLVSLVKV